MLTAFITRRQPMYQLVNLAQKFSLFSEQWQPKVVAEMNDYQFKVVRIMRRLYLAQPPGNR